MTDAHPPAKARSSSSLQGAHVILVGLPGAGKSFFGRAVSKVVNREFLDFDREIERRTGKSVAGIFAHEGEAAFRARELALTRELSAAPAMLISPGGGWVTIPGVMDLVRPPSRIIHLRISTEAALDRLSRSRVVRPLVKMDDPRAAIEQIWADRAELYGLADEVIDVESVDSQQVIQIVASLARNLTTGLG